MKELIQAQSAARIFSREAQGGKLAHAYLFVFPDEKYLRFLLKHFAKILLSASERVQSLIDKECFSDCKIYPAAESKFSVSDANAILEDHTLRPLEGEKKVYLLDRFHEASVSVQNKLLKVLEEPPAGVYFLLGVTSEFPVLPTVLSRVRKMVFPPFTEEQVLSYLKRHYPDRENLSDFAASSGGIVSEAETLLSGSYYGDLLSLCLAVASMRECDLPFLSARAAACKHKSEFLSLLRLVFRDVLMYNSKGTPLLKSVSLENIAKEYSAAACVAVLESIAIAERDMKFNSSFPQLVENLLITIIKEKEKC